MKISIGTIFTAADIFYGVSDTAWKKIGAEKLYNNMIRDNAPRAYHALERAELINATLELNRQFRHNRTITWENGDVEPADLPEALFNGDVRRVEAY